MQAIIAYARLEMRCDCEAGGDTQMAMSLVPSSAAFRFTDRGVTPLTGLSVSASLSSSEARPPSPNFRSEAESLHLQNAHCGAGLTACTSHLLQGLPPTHGPGAFTPSLPQYQSWYRRGTGLQARSAPKPKLGPQRPDLCTSCGETGYKNSLRGQDYTCLGSLCVTLKSPFRILA